MNIDEVKKQKAQAEAAILVILTKFELDTGTRVSCVGFDRDYSAMGPGGGFPLTALVIEAKL